uniref:Uncharacterized protein n=1 Tax=Kalanchoe fedtschenkoi TaxID=63787 RepID=A0A7N0ZZ66_KALFE
MMKIEGQTLLPAHLCPAPSPHPPTARPPKAKPPTTTHIYPAATLSHPQPPRNHPTPQAKPSPPGISPGRPSGRAFSGQRIQAWRPESPAEPAKLVREQCPPPAQQARLDPESQTSPPPPSPESRKSSHRGAMLL